MEITADLYVGSDSLITLAGLANGVSGAYITDATVTVTLLDSAGAEVAGETWPLAMAYVAASDGDYRAVLQDGLGITIGRRYIAVIEADGGGLQGRWEVLCHARRRPAA